MISKILVLADGSAVSEQALIEAIHIAKIFNSIIIGIHPMPRHDPVQMKAGKEIIERYEEMVKGRASRSSGSSSRTSQAPRR